jgi:hypothetical protein
MIAELKRVDNIIRSIKALIPEAGEVRVEFGMEPEFKNGFLNVKRCYWFYLDNPQTSMSFWTLEDLENFVIRKIHALKLLQVSTPTPEQRKTKIAMKQICGNFTKAEEN